LDSASFQFLGFGLAVALASNISRSYKWRSCVLILASATFLALLGKNPISLLPLAGFLFLGFAGIVLLERGWSNLLVLPILAIVFAYAWLKKYTFLPSDIFLDFPYFTVGLSYIFFRVLRLLIEAGEAAGSRHIGLTEYLLYNLNFTTLVSGPIQSYADFARDQFAVKPIPLGPQIVGLQLERIIRGFFKVNVVALLLHALQEDGLIELSQPVPVPLKLLAAARIAVAYPFFLYSNFSGYIDIVIGLSRLMRVRLPENFNRPFSASSFLEFWSRWHITLSDWLKTYVYNPLLMTLMSRVSSLKMQQFLGVFCYFVTFFLIGVWHGRTSEFMFFGVLQGGGVAINKLWQLGMIGRLGRKGYKVLAMNPVYTAIARGLTFTWFAFTLFWFWGTWSQINLALASIGVVRWLGVWLAVWIGATAALAVWEWFCESLQKAKGGFGLSGRFARVILATTLALASFVMTGILSQPAPEIIYKAF
jgi:alginate O-acetyltransferase complex protein AlgI